MSRASSTAVAFDASAETLENWTADVARRQRTPLLSCSDSLPAGQLQQHHQQPSSRVRVGSPEDATRLAEKVMSNRSLPHFAKSEATARLTAEQILSELNAQDEVDAKLRQQDSSVSLTSNFVHQLHNIPVQSPQRTRSNNNNNITLSRQPTSSTPTAPAWADAAIWRQALGIGEAMADQDFSEEYCRTKALEVLTENKVFRDGVEARESRYEADLLRATSDISELEGRVSELQRQLREERMRSDAIMKEDLDGPTYRKREASQLKAKLREVIAVHEVLQWQMHEKDKELRILEDIMKAHMLLHPAPAKPLRLLLSRRLPAFLDRVQQGLPVVDTAVRSMHE